MLSYYPYDRYFKEVGQCQTLNLQKSVFKLSLQKQLTTRLQSPLYELLSRKLIPLLTQMPTTKQRQFVLLSRKLTRQLQRVLCTRIQQQEASLLLQKDLTLQPKYICFNKFELKSRDFLCFFCFYVDFFIKNVKIEL